jgi:hypothetical protein
MKTSVVELQERQIKRKKIKSNLPCSLEYLDMYFDASCDKRKVRKLQCVQLLFTRQLKH